jgi:hypothetical protein
MDNMVIMVKAEEKFMEIVYAIAFIALIIAGFSTVFATKGYYRLYWISAIGIYIFSYLAFPIGQFTVGLTFVLLILAIGYSFGLIRNKIQKVIFLCLGTLIGFLMVIYLRDDLFYPLFPLFN